jgi:hypothetical protein
MLSDQEIVRRLKAIRFSTRSERQARRAPSINAIAKQAGLARPYLFEIISTGRLGSTARAKLNRVFE